MMRRRDPLLAFLGALAAAGLLAGCGGGSSAPITPIGPTGATGVQGSAASKGQFIKQGDSICGESNAAIAGLTGSAAADPQTETQQELQITHSELSSLQSLGTPPTADRATFKSFLSALGNEVAALQKKKTALTGGDATGVSTAESDLASARTSAQSAARQYGFKDCAKPPGTSTTTPGGITTTTTTPPVATTTTAPPPVTTTTAPPPSGGTGGGGTSGGGTGGGGGGSGGIGSG